MQHAGRQAIGHAKPRCRPDTGTAAGGQAIHRVTGHAGPRRRRQEPLAGQAIHRPRQPKAQAPGNRSPARPYIVERERAIYDILPRERESCRGGLAPQGIVDNDGAKKKHARQKVKRRGRSGVGTSAYFLKMRNLDRKLLKIFLSFLEKE